MGLCKCPKKKVTNQFCFEHRVNVCEYCLVSNHSRCIVKSYLHWLQDSDYNPVCTLCNGSLSDGPVIRLVCYDIFHVECLDRYAASLPPNTAPAGYACPNCKSGIFPAENMVSPVADQLRNTLSPASWAKVGLGLPVMPSSAPPAVQRPEIQQNTELVSRTDAPRTAQQPSHLTAQMASAQYSTSTPYNTPLTTKGEQRQARDHLVDMRQQAPTSPPLQQSHPRTDGTVARKIFDKKQDEIQGTQYDHDENKYQRRGAVDWFSRWFGSRTSVTKAPEDPNAPLKRTLVIIVLVVLAFTTLVVVFTRVGRGVANDDPFLDPRANPNIRVKDSQTAS